MAGPSKEELAFETHQGSFDWLVLNTHEGDTYLGCKICAEQGAALRGLSGGKYKIGKYFYKRTLEQHAECAEHAKSVAKLQEASREQPRTPPKKAPPAAQSPGGSLASSPGSSSDSPSKCLQRYSNLLAGAYAAVYHESSCANFQLLTDYARSCGGHLPVAHDSESVFAECRQIISEYLREAFVQSVKASPYYSVSIDEKDRFLMVVITYFKGGQRVTAPVAFRDLSGFEAADLFTCVRSLLESWALPKESLAAFTADGASVMGTRVALGARGDNVAKRLAEWAGHPLLVTHCAPHKLQLSVSASFQEPYFKTLEKQIKALFKNLSEHPGGTIDLVFWSDLTSEEVLSSLKTSSARWLHFLQPVRRLQQCYISVLCHLMYQYKFHANHEQKKTVSWLFQGLASWEARLSLAAVGDVLAICMSCKNRLENAGTLTAVADMAEGLRAELAGYCRKNSVLASAMSGETELPGGGTDAEKICSLYRQERGKKLHLLYTANGHLVDDWVAIRDVADRDHMKQIFQRVQGFAADCAQKLCVSKLFSLVFVIGYQSL